MPGLVLIQAPCQVVDDFSSKLDLQPFETVESIDANHMQMVKCFDKTEEQYRKIAGVLKQFMRSGSLQQKESSKDVSTFIDR